MRHILAVARKMAILAPKGKEKEYFLLGFLHDIGYAFSDNEGHAHAGGELLREQGYAYWKEVYHHGDPFADYSSPELTALNFADMTTDRNDKGY